jgi:hypothetical protein
MRVCHTCREALVGAFDHCLSKETDFNLESVRQVDEVEDGKPVFYVNIPVINQISR